MWKDDFNMRLVNEALTIETTAYALMTALEQNDSITAHAAACYLYSQENYEGGFKSTQVSLMRLYSFFQGSYCMYFNAK